MKKKKINTKPNKKSKEDNYRNIESINYIIKKIEPDGNCFYRAISYFYRDTEEDYTEFREIITSYIEENMGLYIEYIADEDVDIPKEKENNDEFKQNKKLEYMKNYIKEAKKNGTYAGDIEISTAAILFGCNIRIYQQDYGNFSLINEFNQIVEQENNIDKDIINMLFINNNHFQLLIPNNYKKNELISNIIKKSNLKDLIKNVSNSIKINLDLNKKEKNKYITYHRENCENYYTEIHEFLLDGKKIPNRINFSKTTNKKKYLIKEMSLGKCVTIIIDCTKIDFK